VVVFTHLANAVQESNGLFFGGLTETLKFRKDPYFFVSNRRQSPPALQNRLILRIRP
jgi:hypothetical protein